MAKDKKKVLGRGLSALLSEKSAEQKTTVDKNVSDIIGQVLEVPINKIQPNKKQPRSYFNEEALDELSRSIQELGIIQPITVRHNNGQFELISGERRFRASKKAGLTTIPAYVRLANDQEVLEMALVENIQREELDAIEIALTYQLLIDETNLTQEEMSRRVGKNRSTITNYLRLLNLDPIVQTGIRDGMISMGHGRALTGLNDNNVQLDVYEKIIENSLSVRQTEKLIQNQKNPKAKSKPSTLPNEYKAMAKSWTNNLDLPVEIKRNKKGKGKLIINFDNDEDFNKLKSILDA